MQSRLHGIVIAAKAQHDTALLLVDLVDAHRTPYQQRQNYQHYHYRAGDSRAATSTGRAAATSAAAKQTL